MFNIPEMCKIDNTVFKKLFYENGDLNADDKDLFTRGIDKILWKYCLKPENSNIPVYKDDVRDYPEIEIVEVVLQEDARLKRIAEIIMRTIPYPLILIFVFCNKTQIWTAHQRINQIDSAKNIIEDFIHTKWLDDSDFLDNINITKMNMTNFYTLYSGFVDNISIYNAMSITDKVLTGEQARLLIAKLEELDAQITALKSRAKKETQFNKRIEINLEIRKLEQIKKEILIG